MTLLEKIIAERDPEGKDICRCTNAGGSRGKRIIREIGGKGEKEIIGSLKEHDPSGEGVYIEISGTEACLFYDEFPEDADISDVLLAIADAEDEVTGTDDALLAAGADALAQEARKKGVYGAHMRLQAELQEDVFVHHVALPFLRSCGVHVHTAAAKAYARRLAQLRWVEKELPYASLREKARFIGEYLFSRTDCSDAVQKTWKSLLEDIGL